jgi:hypothetical protein
MAGTVISAVPPVTTVISEVIKNIAPRAAKLVGVNAGKDFPRLPYALEP